MRPPRALLLSLSKEMKMRRIQTTLLIVGALLFVGVILFNYNIPFHNAVITLMGGGAGGTSINVDFDPLSTPTLIP